MREEVMKALSWSFVCHRGFFIFIGVAVALIGYAVVPNDYALKTNLIVMTLVCVAICPFAFILNKSKEIERYRLGKAISIFLIITFFTILFFNVAVDEAWIQASEMSGRTSLAWVLALSSTALLLTLFEKRS